MKMSSKKSTYIFLASIGMASILENNILQKRLKYFGGIILILFGIKMMFRKTYYKNVQKSSIIHFTIWYYIVWKPGNTLLLVLQPFVQTG